MAIGFGTVSITMQMMQMQMHTHLCNRLAALHHSFLQDAEVIMMLATTLNMQAAAAHGTCL